MLTYEPILAFTGTNLHVSPFLIGKGEVFFAKNLSSKKIGTFVKTGDYQIKNAQITASQNILGGCDFQRVAGTHTHVVACDGAVNSDIYIDVAGTWTAQSQALTKNNKVRFAYSPALDNLFAVDYVDATRSYNGSAWSTVTNVTGAPKGKVLLAFGERIYILNAVVGATSYATRIYRSSLVDTGSITWDTTNDWITFDDVIVGGGRVGDNMLVLCENSSYIFTNSDEKYQIGKIGCVSHESIAEYDKYTFFASNYGFYATDGTTPQKVSLPIQEIWDNISYANLSEIKTAILDDYVYVFVGNLTYPETINNCLLEYDINQNDWNVIELGTSGKSLHTFVGSSGKKLFLGDNNGKIFQMFTSGQQNAVDFPSVLETHWFYGSSPKFLDDYFELWVYGDDYPSISVSVKLDDENAKWEPVGSVEGSTDFVSFKKRGYRIKFRLQEISGKNLYKLDGLEVGYLPAAEKTK